MSAQDDQAERKRVEVARAMRRSLADLLDNWPMQIEIIAWKAKESRAKYLALLREGFTEDQAIKLCVTM
ncbi:hypothetical protein [Janthinobacterium sp. LB2P10]|uniref:hypothetical protein n=1 Tax=Janthinobacterium sp. LB2P10 TaxID=3424194 RepID=UPI003F1EE34E